MTQESDPLSQESHNVTRAQRVTVVVLFLLTGIAGPILALLAFMTASLVTMFLDPHYPPGPCSPFPPFGCVETPAWGESVAWGLTVLILLLTVVALTAFGRLYLRNRKFVRRGY